MDFTFTGEGLRILDIDCECRPLHWYGYDFVSKEITAIAYAWITKRPRVHVLLLNADGKNLAAILEQFRPVYDAADLVTGHFLRGFDLPLINGAMLDNSHPPLGKKLTQDTKLDLLKFQGLSKSQENLGALLGLRHPKVQMDQRKWREANRLTDEGIALTRKRVVGDVRQHIEMRARMLELGMLRAPRMWAPGGGGGLAGYEA